MKPLPQSTPFNQQNAYGRSDDKYLIGSPKIAAVYGGVAASVRITVPYINTTIPSREGDDPLWSPSLQTLLNQPPARLPQYLILGGILFCCTFGSWSWFGTIEEIGKARGQLVPKGETYKIESVELGKVANVLVQEGEVVKAGQVLVELDTELAQREVDRLEQMLASSRIELGQKQVLLERVRLGAKSDAAMAAAEILAQRSAISAARQKADTIRQLLTQMHLEAAASRIRTIKLKSLSGFWQERLTQLESEVEIHQNRLDRLRPLEQEGAISQEFIFQAEQALRDSQQQITQGKLQELTGVQEQLFQAEQKVRDIKARITQSQGELSSVLKEVERLQVELTQKQATERKIQLESEQKIQQLELEITQLEAKIAETENLLVTAQAKLKQNFLKAPVDGLITSLDLQNIGEVVQPSQTIAEIAPQGQPLIISAVLPNQEAGFIKEDMPVQVKFDAYPYQDYGVISGKVISISADAESDEQLGTVYRVQVSLERDYITHEQQKIDFKYGQTVTAEIIIRNRRIADILLEPIRKLKEDGINL